MGYHALLQGIFPTQGSIPGLPLEGGFFTDSATREAVEYGMDSLFLLQGISLTQELNWGLLYCRWILYQLSYQGSPWHT